MTLLAHFVGRKKKILLITFGGICVRVGIYVLLLFILPHALFKVS